MEITLYKSTALIDKINKESFLEVYKKIIGNLRDEADLASPTITIELYTVDDKLVKADNIQVVDINLIEVLTIDDIPDLIKCNYLYIKEFERYYFIKNITAVRTNLWELDCEVDTLMSFKTYLNEVDGFLDRGDKKYINPDVILLDPALSVSSIKNVYVNDTYNTIIDFTKNGNTVVSWVGSGVRAASEVLRETKEVVPNKNGLNNYPIKFTLFNTGWCNLGILNASQLIQLFSALNTNSKIDFGYFFSSYDPANFIQSLRWYPFDISKFLINPDVANGNIIVGIWDSKVSCKPMNNSNIKNTIEFAEPIIFPNIYSSSEFQFLAYNPYTEYSLYVPFFDWIDLPAEEIIGNKLYFRLSINFNTGEGMLIILVSDRNKTIDDARVLINKSSQLGIDIPISGTNLREVTANFYRGMLSLGTAGVAAATGSIPKESTSTTTSTTTTTKNKQKPVKVWAGKRKQKYDIMNTTDTTTSRTGKTTEFTTHPSPLAALPISEAINSAIGGSNVSAHVQRSSGNTPLNNYALSDKMTLLIKTSVQTIDTVTKQAMYEKEYGFVVNVPMKMGDILKSNSKAMHRYSMVNINSIPGATDNELAMLEEKLLEGFHV